MTNTETIQHQLNTLLASKDVYTYVEDLMEPYETADELYWLLNSFEDGKGYQYHDGATSYTENMLLNTQEVKALEQLAKDLKGAK